MRERVNDRFIPLFRIPFFVRILHRIDYKININFTVKLEREKKVAFFSKENNVFFFYSSSVLSFSSSPPPVIYRVHRQEILQSHKDTYTHTHILTHTRFLFKSYERVTTARAFVSICVFNVKRVKGKSNKEAR